MSSYKIEGLFAYWLGSISALFTAFYSTRPIYFVFISKTNNSKIIMSQVHDAPFAMALPLIVLGFGSIFSGYLVNSQLYAVVFYPMVSLLCYFGAAVYLLEMAGVFKKIAVGLLLKEIAIGVVAGLVVYSFSTAGYAFAISISLVLMSLGLLRSYFKYRSFSEIKV